LRQSLAKSVLERCRSNGYNSAHPPWNAQLPSIAGGARVSVVPTHPPTRSKNPKILSVDELIERLDRRRAAGQCVVMTNGCFDLLHPGHVASLEFARRHGDCLVVGLNSDRSARMLKGPGHPIVDQHGRAAMLAALACVDYVVLFDHPSVAGLIERVVPDVLVKSAEYAVEEVVGHETVLAHGGRVALAPRQGDYSTTRLIERILETRDA
jgi:rfaE bifunctional protein nucleotidyltransferase chain/domain